MTLVAGQNSWSAYEGRFKAACLHQRPDLLASLFEMSLQRDPPLGAPQLLQVFMGMDGRTFNAHRFRATAAGA